MQAPIRVGLVGYGIAGQVMHAPFIATQPEYLLVSVLERHQERSLAQFPNVKIVRSIDELVADPGIDLVVITTPNDTHFEYCVKALHAGKHVVLEKPFTNTTSDAKKLVELAKKSPGILSVYQNRRYVGDFLTLRKVLAEGILGDVHEFEAHYDRYRPEQRPSAWREENKPGSGILWDLGAHLIDQALVLFGLPLDITADIRQQRTHARVDDYFDLRMNYGFTKVIVKSGMLVREPGPRYMMHGTKGSFLKSGEDVQEALLRKGIFPNITNWGIDPEEQWGLLHTEINGEIVKERYPTLPGSFGLYYKHLAETILHGAPLQVKPEHGHNTIRVMELAVQSNTEKRTVSCEGFIPSNYE